MTNFEEYVDRINREADDPINTETTLLQILEEAEYDPEISESQREHLYDLSCEVYGYDLG